MWKPNSQKRLNIHHLRKTMKANKEEKQIKLELAKQKVKGQFKLQGIYKRRQLETIKNIDVETTNYVVEHLKPVVVKYRVFLHIYFSYVFLSIKFSLFVLNFFYKDNQFTASCKGYKKQDSRRRCHIESTKIYPYPNDCFSNRRK